MELNFSPEDITQKFEMVSPSQARRMLDDAPYVFQRKIDQTYVQEYLRAMRRGEFRPGTEATFAQYAGKLHAMNCQHTLTALSMHDKPLLLSIVTYKCHTAILMHGLYLTFDRNRLRSLTQLYAAYDFPNTSGLNNEQTKHLGAAIGLVISGFAPQGTKRSVLGPYFHSGHIRIACMQAWLDEALAFFETIKGAPKTISSLLRRGPIMAIALVTFRYTGADASEFWKAVAWDDNLAFDDPRKALHKWIREHMLKEYEPHQYAKFVAVAWNAAWEERHLQRLNVTPQQTTQPIRIAGTPFDGLSYWTYIAENGEPLQEPRDMVPPEKPLAA